MAAADIGEVLAQMRIEMLDDAELTSLLGETTTGIFRMWPAGAHAKPMILIDFDELNPQVGTSGVGIYRPSISFDLIVLNPWDAGPIYDVLESRWSIPSSRQHQIVTTNFKLNSLSFDGMLEVPGSLREVDTGEVVRQFRVSARAKIIKSA